jgi:lipopolysaccharide/colanic/teichoic acid biosynthesis glycosyltransferase
VRAPLLSGPCLILKRTFDVLASGVGLLLIFPLLLLMAVLVKVDSPGPVLYRGMRVGLNGKPFHMLKFRTMVVDAEKLGASSTARGDARITRVGNVIRACKFDEFPQLVNVFRGDMSLVGPRPQVQWAVDLYTEEERLLLSVRPGITDHASLLFSDEAEILNGAEDPDKAYLELIAPEKIRLGLEYVRTRTFWVDLKLILLTLTRVSGRSEL